VQIIVVLTSPWSKQRKDPMQKPVAERQLASPAITKRAGLPMPAPVVDHLQRRTISADPRP
jgi:hypothetical protein